MVDLAEMIINLGTAHMKDVSTPSKKYANYKVESLDHLAEATLDIGTNIRH